MNAVRPSLTDLHSMKFSNMERRCLDMDCDYVAIYSIERVHRRLCRLSCLSPTEPHPPGDTLLLNGNHILKSADDVSTSMFWACVVLYQLQTSSTQPENAPLVYFFAMPQILSVRFVHRQGTSYLAETRGLLVGSQLDTHSSPTPHRAPPVPQRKGW